MVQVRRQPGFTEFKFDGVEEMMSAMVSASPEGTHVVSLNPRFN